MRRVNSWASSSSFRAPALTSNIRRQSMLLRDRRRTQRARSAATRAALAAAARDLFTERGFHGTPAELVVRRAGVTSGALYHHFSDKRALFRAVFDAAERGLAERVAAAARGGLDPRDPLERGVVGDPRAGRQPDVPPILLPDRPLVPRR